MTTNRTRTLRRMALAAIAVLVVLTMGGCSLLGTTPELRVEAFVDSMNNGLGIQSNLDPNATSYSTAATLLFWNQYFPASQQPYSVSGDVTVSGSTATAQITTSGSLGTRTFTFTMVEDAEGGFFGSNFLISRIAVSGTTIFQ